MFKLLVLAIEYLWKWLPCLCPNKTEFPFSPVIISIMIESHFLIKFHPYFNDLEVSTTETLKNIDCLCFVHNYLWQRIKNMSNKYQVLTVC